MFPGGRSILAASAFFKYFDQPIERVVIAGAQPIVTFQNADKARNFGVELEAGHELSAAASSSTPTTRSSTRRSRCCPSSGRCRPRSSGRWPASRRTSSTSPASTRTRGFSARVLVNYFGDRISDVGANQAPDIVEQGRGSSTWCSGSASAAFNVRFSGREPDRQRIPVHPGRPRRSASSSSAAPFGVSFGVNVF